MAHNAENLMRSIVAHAGEWILPYWLERQLNPANPSYVPALGTDAPKNITHLNTVPVGTLGSPEHAQVDPRGLVTPWPGGWGLDWWAGADDRWRIPAREGGVRQGLASNTPVVETTMRVPGGDFVERVWAFHDSETGPTLAVEFANESKAPLALALAIRPFGVLGHNRVASIAVTETQVNIDGRVAVWLPKPAHRIATSHYGEGDVARVVMTGEATSSASATVECEAGFAQAALIFPLSHSASLRVLIPLKWISATDAPRAPSVVPPYDAVARGWQSHVGRGTRIVVPDQTLSDTFERARTQLLLVSPSVDLAQSDIRNATRVVRALNMVGLHDEAELIVETLPQGQGPGGQLGGKDQRKTATGAALVAFGEHVLYQPAWKVDEMTLAMAAAGAHHRPGVGRWSLRHRNRLNLVEAAWQLRGATAMAEALRQLNQIEAAVEIESRTEDLHAIVDDDQILASLSEATTDPVSLLDLVQPLALVDSNSSVATSLLELLKRRYLHEGAVIDRSRGGVLSPSATARYVQALLRRGDREALESLRWLHEMAVQHLGWPTRINAATGGGADGESWAAGAAADYVETVCDMLAYVGHRGGEVTQLVLCPVLPETWLGGNIELHNLNTFAGQVSYGIRWHGKRAALLWEFVPNPGFEEVRITIPGVDPMWSTSQLRGDALLGVPPIAEASESEETPEELVEQEVTLSLGVRSRSAAPQSPSGGSTVTKPIPASQKMPPASGSATVSFPGLNPEDGESFS